MNSSEFHCRCRASATHALGVFKLRIGAQIETESKAMVSLSANVKAENSFQGGPLKEARCSASSRSSSTISALRGRTEP